MKLKITIEDRIVYSLTSTEGGITPNTIESELPVTGDMVCGAMKTARSYIEKKLNGIRKCMNVAGNASDCSCIFDMRGTDSRSTTEDSLKYTAVCKNMAKWFEETRIMERSMDSGLMTVNEFKRKIGAAVWIQPKNSYRAMTKMLNMRMTDETEAGRGEATKNFTATRNYPDWNLPEQGVGEGLGPNVCVPTALLVWQILVGEDSWEYKEDPLVAKWLRRKYRDILDLGGSNASLKIKQTLRQRLFYARIPDYMSASPQAKQIKTDKCLETFKKHNWAVDEGDEEEKKGKSTHRLRNRWDSWRFNKIHILRGDSEILYNEKTKNLVDKFKIKVESLHADNVDFLEQLFMLVGNRRRRLGGVSVDKKLLFLPFKNCTTITNALQVFYTMKNASKSKDEKQFMDGENYNTRLCKADDEIKEKLKLMIGNDTKEVAYQTSVLVTAVHHPQEPHVDYDMATGNHKKYMVAFLPLTETGQFLQMWEPNTGVEGQPLPVGDLIFIPRGQLVLVPGDTIHGGGFRADTRSDNGLTHLRLHFYVYPGETTCMVASHKNQWLNPPEKEDALYLHNPELYEKNATALNFTFFQAVLE